MNENKNTSCLVLPCGFKILFMFDILCSKTSQLSYFTWLVMSHIMVPRVVIYDAHWHGYQCNQQWIWLQHLRAIDFGHQKRLELFEFLKVLAYDSTIWSKNAFFLKYPGRTLSWPSIEKSPDSNLIMVIFCSAGTAALKLIQ